MYTYSDMHVLICTKTLSVAIPQQPKRIRTASKTESEAHLPGHVHRQHEHKDCPPEF